MNEADLEGVVRAALLSVAPETEDEPLDPAVSFRDQLDIDSMDFLNFLVAVGERVGVEIPESDYAQVSSIDGCVRYLAARL